MVIFSSFKRVPAVPKYCFKLAHLKPMPIFLSFVGKSKTGQLKKKLTPKILFQKSSSASKSQKEFLI